MHAHASGPTRTIVPTLRYRDVAAAIDWLCNAFDFERHLVVPGEDGAIRYAQLTFGDGMIMLGPVGAQSAVDGLMTQPADTGGAETQICYLFVEDAAAHCERAKAAGAEIVLDIEEEGGRGYSCRDPEGHIWNFGTYDPWKRQPGKRRARPGGACAAARRRAGPMGQEDGGGDGRADRHGGHGRGRRPGVRLRRMAAVGERDARSGGAAGVTEQAGHEQLARAREAREAAEQAAKEARERLAQEQGARETAERARRRSGQESPRAAREGGSRAERQGKRELRERFAAAEHATAALRNELAAERIAREAADRTTHQMREQLERETSSKDEAERIKQARKTASEEEHASIEARQSRRLRRAERTFPRRARRVRCPKQACSSGVHLRGTDLHPSVAAATTAPILAIHLLPPILRSSGVDLGNVDYAVAVVIPTCRAIAIANTVLDPAASSDLIDPRSYAFQHRPNGGGLGPHCDATQARSSNRDFHQSAAQHNLPSCKPAAILSRSYTIPRPGGRPNLDGPATVKPPPPPEIRSCSRHQPWDP